MGGTEPELRAILKDEKERTQLLEDEPNNSNGEIMRKMVGCIAAALLALIVALSSICVQALQVGFHVFVFIQSVITLNLDLFFLTAGTLIRVFPCNRPRDDTRSSIILF